MIPASITNYLEQNQARYSVIPHRPAYTAQEEAAAAHVPGAAWAKSVVCTANDELFLAVVPAPYTVDFERLKRAIDADSVRLALDTSLARDPEIVFSGGSHGEAIRMPYREFERLSRPTIAKFATGPKLP